MNARKITKIITDILMFLDFMMKVCKKRFPGQAVD